MTESTLHLRHRLGTNNSSFSGEDRAAALLLDVEAPPAAISFSKDGLGRFAAESGNAFEVLRWIRKGDFEKLHSFIDSDAFKRRFLTLIIVDLVLVSVHLQLAGLFGAEELLWLCSEIANFCVLLANILDILIRIATESTLSLREQVSRLNYSTDVAKKVFVKKPLLSMELIFLLVSMLLELSAFHKVKIGARIVVRVFRSFGLIHALAVAVEIERQEANKLQQIRYKLAQAEERQMSLLNEIYHERSVRAKLEGELSRLNSCKRSGEEF